MLFKAFSPFKRSIKGIFDAAIAQVLGGSIADAAILNHGDEGAPVAVEVDGPLHPFAKSHLLLLLVKNKKRPKISPLRVLLKCFDVVGHSVSFWYGAGCSLSP